MRRLLPVVLTHFGHAVGFLTLVAAAAGIWGAHGMILTRRASPNAACISSAACICDLVAEHEASLRVPGPFMSWPASFLSGPAAATGFAVINSCGSIGGFVGPFLIGALTAGR